MTANKNKPDEIDLLFLINKLKEVFESTLLFAYRIVRHILRNWIVLLILVIVGYTAGYFLDKVAKKDRLAKVVVRTNFGMANYTYQALDLLQEKSLNGDTAFFRDNKFRSDTFEIKKIKIKPFINLSELSKGFDPEDRSLESILRNVTFEEDSIIPASFKYSYQNHLMEIRLSHVGSKESVERVLSYLNNGSMVKEVAKSGKEILETSLKDYNTIIDQLDVAIEEYQKEGRIPSPSDQIYIVEKDFKIADLVYRKEEAIKLITNIKEDLVYADNAIVAINEPEVITLYKSALQKNRNLIPVLLLFLYGAFIFLKRTNSYIKKLKEKRGLTDY